MKKIAEGIIKISIFSVISVLCLVPLLTRKSSGVSVSLMDEVMGNIRSYAKNIQSKHRTVVSVNDDALSERAALINDLVSSVKRKDSSLNIDKDSSADVWRKANNALKDGSAKANILAGYASIKQHLDPLFKEIPKTKAEANSSSYNLRVSYNNALSKYYKYFMYEQIASPSVAKEDYKKTFLSSSRLVKRRVEDLILAHKVTGDKKYLMALVREIATAAKWSNLWQSSQYIDTVEVAYAVSLGYNYAYESLTDRQKCDIENRLLMAVLLYGTSNYAQAMNDTRGNFSQVGNAGAGIAALALLESGVLNNATIKVTSIDKANGYISYNYPVQAIVNDKLTIGTSTKLLKDTEGTARVTDPVLYNLLTAKYPNLGKGSTINLKVFYAAVIAKTTEYLPRILKLSNMGIDGSYPEGKNYYLFGMKYFSYYLATLRNTILSSGSVEEQDYYGMLNFEGDKTKSKNELNNIVLYPVYIANAKGGNFDYSDAAMDTISDKYRKDDNGKEEPGGYSKEDDLFYLANINAKMGKNEETAKVIYDHRKRTSRQYWRFYSIMWYDQKYDKKTADVDYNKTFNAAYYQNKQITNSKKTLSRLNVSAFRSSYTNENGIFVAMKGGRTADNHTHLDLGTYVLDAMGTRWIADSGSQYDGTKYNDKEYLRWQYYVTRAEAHSTLVINTPKVKTRGSKGQCLEADQWVNAEAVYEKFESSDNSNIATVDLTSAYNKEYDDSLSKSFIEGVSVRRGLKLFDNKKYVLVQDELNLKNMVSLYSFLNVNKSDKITSKIVDSDRRVAILEEKDSHNKMLVLLVSDNDYVKFSKMKADGVTTPQKKNINAGDGFVNKFLRDLNCNNVTCTEYKKGEGTSNSNVNLKLNRAKVNNNKLVIHIYEKNGTPRDEKIKIGVYYIPLGKNSRESVKSLEEKLKKTDLVALDNWYIPGTPNIKVYNGNKELKSGAKIKGSAVIKLSVENKKKKEIIKYSLDGGKSWNSYNDSDSKDVKKRTFSEAGKKTISVLAYVDDGNGVQGNTKKLNNFSFEVERSSSSNPAGPSNPSGGSGSHNDESSKNSNNNLKSLTVEGYKLNTTDDINYSLTVDNEIKRIKVIAVAEDAKATIRGAGEVELAVGKNKFEIVVTAENGSVKTYVLTVTRKSITYSIDDIDKALNGKKEEEPSIVLKDGDALSEKDLKKIHESGKTIDLVKYDDGGGVVYSLAIDGSKINSFEAIKADSLYTIRQKSQPDDETGSDLGYYLRFSAKNLPSGSRFKVNVSDEYSDGDKVTVYAQYESGPKVIKETASVEDGMLTFNLASSQKYFIATIAETRPESESGVESGEEKNSVDFAVVFGAVGVTILMVTIASCVIIKVKRN